MWANFHTHTDFCDGKSTFTEHINKATELEVKILGFSSHAPVPFDCNWCMKSVDLDTYLKTITELKASSSIEIYAGLEIDFVPGSISPNQFNNRLDYTIGSIHFIDAFADGKPWEIDGTHAVFLNGLETIFKNSYKAAFVRYFELTRQMIEKSCPSVVGHLDKMKIQNHENKFFLETDAWYQTQVNETLSQIKKSGAIVEVNTRGIYQKKTTTTYPSPWILELILKEGIPITLSSDAHHADDLVNQFEETAKLLLHIGFKKLHFLHEGEWKAFNFKQNGILF